MNTYWNLHEAHRHHRSSGDPQLSEGDIVVDYAGDLPPNNWKIEWIEQVITETDGQRRATTVRVSKNSQTSTLDRPIQHFHLLEIVPYTDTVSEQGTKEAHDATVHKAIMNNQIVVLLDRGDQLLFNLVIIILTQQMKTESPSRRVYDY